MPRLHFHPFCVLISAIRGFAIDINLMAIYWYSSITYLAGRNYQQKGEADRCDAGARAFLFLVNQGEELLRATLAESELLSPVIGQERGESRSHMKANNRWKACADVCLIHPHIGEAP